MLPDARPFASVVRRIADVGPEQRERAASEAAAAAERGAAVTFMTLPEISPRSPRSPPMTPRSTTSSCATRPISPESRLLKPLHRFPDLKLAQGISEMDEARAQLVKQRMLSRGQASGARLLVHAARRANAIALREELEDHSGRSLRVKLGSVEPASETDVVDLATRLNMAMCQLFPEQRSQTTYFLLFRTMDEVCGCRRPVLHNSHQHAHARALSCVRVGKRPEQGHFAMLRPIACDAGSGAS